MISPGSTLRLPGTAYFNGNKEDNIDWDKISKESELEDFEGCEWRD